MPSLRNFGPWLAVICMSAFGGVELWRQSSTFTPIMCFSGAAFIAGMMFGDQLARPAFSEVTSMTRELMVLVKEQAAEIARLRRRMHLN